MSKIREIALLGAYITISSNKVTKLRDQQLHTYRNNLTRHRIPQSLIIEKEHVG